MVDTLCFFFLSSLPISVLRILDTEANKFYDRNHQLCGAALLTGCCTQHALRPFVNSEVGRRRRFVGIPFVDEGIEFIDLPGVFGDGSVASSVPAYFRSSGPPVVCYKYSRPVGGAVFGFGGLVAGLGVRAGTPGSWDCGGSRFMYPAAGRVVTGGLGVISGSGVRCIVSGGPRCRFHSRVDFGECGEEVASALDDFGGRWCGREYVGPGALGEWRVGIFKIVDQRVKFYSQSAGLLPPGPGSAFRHLRQGVRGFRGKCVLVPADGAAGGVVVV